MKCSAPIASTMPAASTCSQHPRPEPRDHEHDLDAPEGTSELVAARGLIPRLRRATRVRRDVERKAERDDDPLPVVDADDRRPDDEIGERRPGKEDQAEHGPDPGAERGVDPVVVEEPPEKQRDAGADESRREGQATHWPGTLSRTATSVQIDSDNS